MKCVIKQCGYHLFLCCTVCAPHSQPAPPAASYQMGAYGNQPVSMAPPGMPGAQMLYGGGYPPTLSQQHQMQQMQQLQQQQQQQQQLAGLVFQKVYYCISL